MKITMALTRTRLTTDQKMQALAMLARGDTLSQVAGFLMESYDISITESALSQLRKANRDVIERMKDTLEAAHTAEAEDLVKKTRSMLVKKLNKAERDEKTLEELDQQYRDGDIKRESYRQKKAGLLKISIAELNSISKTAHDQMIKDRAPAGPDSPLLPSGNNATPQQLENLIAAINSGNTVELQRMIFNPK